MGRQRLLQPVVVLAGVYLCYTLLFRPAGQPAAPPNARHPRNDGGLVRDSVSASHRDPAPNNVADSKPEVIPVGLVAGLAADAQPHERSAAEAAWGEVKNAERVHSVEIRSRNFDTLGPDISPTRLHGRLGLKEDGTPGWTPHAWLDHDETMAEKHEHHAHNCFNLFRSDSISLDREIPDSRASACVTKHKSYSEDLPQTSVIFVFYNEPLSPLLRSIHSVLNKSPPHLLKEIILIDDGSDKPWTQQPLEDYINLLPKVILKRMGFRQGLMGTREEGARIATAETVTFLDSHIEVNVGWLEPMLARIHEDRRHAVMPIIDSIDPDNFRYRAGGLDILGFSWSLGQKGMSRTRSRDEPMPSPVMAGGLFAMDRRLFFELGGYDPEMKLYGGEEMEISFRLWQCGNTLECIPCSRVGHVFRTGRFWKGQVYTVPGDVIIRNKLRAAYMWLDQYSEIAHNVMGNLPKGKTVGDLGWGAKVRNHCLNGSRSHSFEWYLKNVYPELTDVLGVAEYNGEISNAETRGCIDTLGNHNTGGVMGLYPCHHSHGTQEFLFGKDGQLRIALADFTMCLQSKGAAGPLYGHYCPSHENPKLGFEHGAGGVLKERTSGLCLTADRAKSKQSPLSLKVALCAPADAPDPLQSWAFTSAKSVPLVTPL